jgi:uncharacterized protein YigE (DUF2233 family)
MSIERSLSLLLPLFAVGSCLFMNSANEEDMRSDIGLWKGMDSTKTAFQSAIDSVEATVMSWEKVLDSLHLYRTDSLSQERQMTSFEASKASLQKRIIDLLPSGSSKESTNPRLSKLTQRIFEFASTKDSLEVMRSRIKGVDSLKARRLYDSLSASERQLGKHLASLDNSLDQLISVESKKISDSTMKQHQISSEISADLKKQAVKVMASKRQSIQILVRLNIAKSRLRVLKSDSSQLQQAVNSISRKMDGFLNHDSISGRIHRIRYRSVNYRVFIADRQNHLLQIHPNETGSLVYLNDEWKQLKKHKDLRPLIACNAGMYNDNGSAVGLCISKRRLVSKLNTDTNIIPDNFHLYPNGVFFVDSVTGYSVVKTGRMAVDLKDKRSIIHATQSGPMLVVDGNIHPSFMRNSTNLNIRNGIGVIDSSKSRRCAIVISDDPVNFHDFASLFKHVLRCGNALYLDGAISQMVGENPEDSKGRRAIGLGPILSVSAIQPQRKGK